VSSPTPRPLLLGHRGARPLPLLGLRWRKPSFPAENTIAAFDYALANGCGGFEFDVRYTRDRRSVLHHDAALKRHEIAATDYSGLERRSGYNLACLEDVLARFGARAYLDIELKVEGNEDAIVAAVRAKRPQRGFVVSSFLPEVLLRLHELDSSLPLGYVCDRVENVARWTRLPITALFPQHDLVSQRLIDDAHARSVQLLTWTVNDSRDMVRLAGWGVDGLISDSPVLAQQHVSRDPARTGSELTPSRELRATRKKTRAARLYRLLKNPSFGRFVSGHDFSRADRAFIFSPESASADDTRVALRVFQYSVFGRRHAAAG